MKAKTRTTLAAASDVSGPPRTARSPDQEREVDGAPRGGGPEQIRDGVRMRQRRGRRLHAPLLVLLALAVGSLIAAWRPLVYRCTATLRVAPDSPRGLESVRNALLAYLWEAGFSGPGRETNDGRVHVEARADGTLLIHLLGRSRSGGQQRLAALMAGFVDQQQRALASARQTPAEAESLLADRMAQLDRRLAHLEADVRRAPSSGDPADQYESLRAQWSGLSSRFVEARRVLSETAAELARARASAAPTHGVVSGDARRAAHASDSVLQHELNELRVNLAELRQQVLRAWQDSGGPLEQLSLRVDEWLEVCEEWGGPSAAAESRVAPRPCSAAQTAQLAEALASFARVWNREAHGLRSLELDAYSEEILERYRRMHKHLDDFLFAFGNRLTSLRGELRRIGVASPDEAQFHVAYSRMVRSFHAVEAAYHRFEGSAELLDTPTNFRLDSALKASRGLRRRTQDRIRQVEEQLQAQAGDRARREHVRRLGDLEALADARRREMNGLLDRLIAIQEQLNESADAYAGLAHLRGREAVCSDWIEEISFDRQDTGARLEAVRRIRLTALDGADVKVTGLEASSAPVNLAERLTLGGVAALLTIVAAGFGPRWVMGRSV